MRLTPLLEAHRLPSHLVCRALHEMAEHGVILMDTAAELIEHGADIHRLESQVEEQAHEMEGI